MTAKQLAFDLDAAMQDDDLEAQIRAAVVEDDMSPEEAEAAVADALAQVGLDRAPEAAHAPGCVCEGGSLLIDGLAVERTCARCGREPRR